MKIVVLKERHPDENRVAISPDAVKKYIALGADVMIESKAGLASAIPDDIYAAAGASISKDRSNLVKSADILLTVRAPHDNDIKDLKKGALVLGMLNPHGNDALVKACADAGITAMSMELLPRITRAQAMDVLSSQANLAGYKAVLDACDYYTKAMPMMMTAAGTIPPAKVFIMGAGVAGLQAIATARRLGAVVSATDVRPPVKEQVESLGAKFVAVEDDEFKSAESASGYAKEMSDEYKKKQAELVAQTIAKQDIVITTALIPGRVAPRLISADMIKTMAAGSVIVDMAVEQGGNVEGSKPGEIVTTANGVIIIGHKNIPGRLAASASLLYAKNLLNLVQLIVKKDKDDDKSSPKITLDWDDDIIKGVGITHDGKIIHPSFAPNNAADKNKDKAKDETKSAKPANMAENKKPVAKKAPAEKTTAKKPTSKKPAPKKTTNSKTVKKGDA